MQQRIRTSNSLLVSAEQPDETQFPALDPATQGIIAGNTTLSYDVQTVETSEATGSLDQGERRSTGINASLTARVFVTGADAAGTAPGWARLLKPCGWAETITAADVPAAPEAVGDGSTTTTVVLGAAASAQDQIYRGMPLHLTGDMDVITFITDYDGATKIATVTDTLPSAPASATTDYQILANVRYGPASDSIPLFAHEVYLDGIRVRIDGSQGNAQLVWDTRGVPAVDFIFQARFVDEVDMEVPAIVDSRPVKPVFRAGKMLLDRRAVAIQNLTVNPQAEVEFGDDPNAEFGFLPAAMTARQMQATLNPEMRKIADGGDVMAEVAGGSEITAYATCGTLAGNRPAIVLPRAALLQSTPGTRGGFRTRDHTLDLRGADAGAFLTIY